MRTCWCAWKVVLCAIVVVSPLDAQPNRAADFIIANARVWTGNKSQPSAEAVAILGERIVAVGSTSAMNAWRGASTRVLDAQGRLLLPGFNDAHVHLVSGGAQLDNVNLRDAATQREFALRIFLKARHAAKGEWVVGGDWDDQLWVPARVPTKGLIDPGTRQVPVFVNRYDGHMGLANSLALKLAGITEATPDPPGGEIVRDPAGNPTGLLKDAAADLVYKVIPPMSSARRVAAIKRALKHAASLGVTSVQDMNPEYADVAQYAALAERNELTLRIYAAPIETGWEDQAKLGLRHAFGSSYLRLGAVKGYADGSLGSTTAYFFDPYADAPGSRGLLSDEMQPPAKMLERLTRADAAGLQLCIHAIGDRGISIILDFFDQIQKANGIRDRRFRIEHAQHISPGDFARFRQLEVIASVQPYHAIDDGRWAEKRIGSERIKTTYAFRTLLDHGVRLALGTDWTVAPLNPMLTLYAAVTRATLDGKNPAGWMPQEKLNLPEAVEAYTMGSAYAEYQEKEKGSIEAGKLADMVLLDSDIFHVAPEQIKTARVMLTMVGGRVVYGPF